MTFDTTVANDAELRGAYRPVAVTKPRILQKWGLGWNTRLWDPGVERHDAYYPVAEKKMNQVMLRIGSSYDTTLATPFQNDA